MRTIVTILFVWLAALCLECTCLAQTYTIKDLGALSGISSVGQSVNASGQVTGYFTTLNGEDHAFLYSGGLMKDLGTLGGRGSKGFGINRSGQVTGFAVTTGSTTHTFLYNNGQMTDLGTLGGSFSSGQGINDAGQVTGFSFTMNDSDFHAFLYSNGVMTDIGTLGGRESFGQSINTSGQVTGGSTTTDQVESPEHAFIYSRGTVTDLGTLGGTNSLGEGINGSGQVTGRSFITGNTASHAFFYSGGAMKDLGTLGGLSSEGHGINTSGQVTGQSYITGNTAQHAFLYASTSGMVDLNTLIPANSGWTLTDAFAINDSGQITGVGKNPDGKFHAFLLSPAPTADLAIHMVAAKAVRFGGNLHYVLVVRNKGPQAAKNVVVTDTLPRGAIRVVNFQRICQLKHSNTLTCKLGNIAAGHGKTIHFMLEDVTFANVGSRFTNRARVSGAVMDPNTANNTSSRTTRIK